jgi:hypothetical protein
MKKPASNEVKRGQAISFRVPSDTPDHLLKQLQRLKVSERRNFSSKIAEFVLEGVGSSFHRERESITIPLPHKLSKSQRDWLKHEHSEALLGSIIYQLLSDPVRATSLLAALNSSSVDINEALYLQEEIIDNDNSFEQSKEDRYVNSYEEIASAEEYADEMDDLDSFDWEMAQQQNQSSTEEVEEEDENENNLDSLLGDFLAKMNK